MYFTLLEDKGLCLEESSNSKMLTCLRINYKLLLLIIIKIDIGLCEGEYFCSALHNL